MDRSILIFNLKLLRQAHQINQGDLSFQLGMESHRINQIENQPKIKISQDEIHLIANHFGIDPIKLQTIKGRVIF